jgi:hypothetical protein
MPKMIAIALEVLMYWPIKSKDSFEARSLKMDKPKVAPNNSKTMETVVEVGKPKELKISNKITSVIMTARKMVSNSGMVKNFGIKIPFLATSIIPEEKVTPARIPQLATRRIINLGATLEPKEEFKKLAASLLTPTIKSKMEKRNNRNKVI